jgi:hypothetical protein
MSLRALRVGVAVFVCVAWSGSHAAEAGLTIARALAQTSTAQDGSLVSKSSAAFDPVNQVYLVVWSNFQSKTYGQLLNQAGDVVGGPFRITGSTAGYARVVWGRDGFFVTYNPTNTSQRWGRFVNYVSGGAQLGNEVFLYDCWAIDSDQGMTYVPGTGQYLLTFWLNTTRDTPYTRTYLVGVKNGIVNIPATQISDNAGGVSQDSAEIACDETRDRCLVVGKAWDNYGFIGTWARVITASSGLPTGNVFYLDRTSKILNEDQRVAFSPLSGRFVATWVRGRASVVARRVYSDLSVEGAYYTVIGGNYGQQSISYNSGTNTFAVTFKDGNTPAQNFAQELTGSGDLSGVPLQLSTIGTTGDGFPITVPNPGAKQFLAIHGVNFLYEYTGLLNATEGFGGGGGGNPPPAAPRASAPVMSLDTPTDGNAFRVPLTLYGWAADTGAPTGTGVDAVHVWAYPNPGSGQPARFVGSATYGQARGDVAAALGDARFTNSGFSMPLSNMAAGVYQLVVSAHSTVTGTFNQARTATVVIRGPLVALDGPTQNAQVKAPFVISGWAGDSGAASGTGVDAVHVWAYPNPGSGAAPLFIGAATYGQARPDVAQALGASRFTNVGYSMTGLNLKPGPYLLVAFAHMTESGQWVPATANITVAPGPLMYVDTPFSGQSVTVWSVISGWAADMSSPTGTGVDVVHVWAYPVNGAAPIFIGQANYGSDRPDVAGYIGARFRYSGFWLPTPKLPPGGYYFVAFARNATTQQFTNAVSVAVQMY